jgi:nitroimidazol reductase NimA-like FMN-containing flavoprotein (pyridoxamine 5'-phosphate oxidase superfamily)
MGKIFVLDPAAIEDLLRTALVGRIACCDHGASGGDGRPFLVPLAYGYDGESVYAFSAPGRKIHTMRRQPLVSFEVDTALAADRWSSVIADATYEELTSEEDRRRGLEIIANGGPLPDVTSETIVYRLHLTSKSGRFEVPDDEAHLYQE